MYLFLQIRLSLEFFFGNNLQSNIFFQILWSKTNPSVQVLEPHLIQDLLEVQRLQPKLHRWFSQGCTLYVWRIFRILICPMDCTLAKETSLKVRIVFFNLVKSNKSKFFFREIAFLTVLNFFPVQKMIFGHFWNSKKWNLVKKFFREIDLFDFTNFFGLDFFHFYGPLYGAAR